jgi:hypothetical protein
MGTKKGELLKTTTNHFLNDSGSSDKKKDFEIKLISNNDLRPIMLNDEEAVNLSENSNYNLDLNISEFNDSNLGKNDIFKHPYKDVR